MRLEKPKVRLDHCSSDMISCPVGTKSSNTFWGELLEGVQLSGGT